MLKRTFAHGLLLLLAVLVGSVFQPFTSFSVQAQPGCQSFPQTGKQVCGRFLQYWQQNGGLAQQGLPLTGEFTEVSDLNGQSYTVQYFERAVFEKHPENAAPHDVLLSQLGTFQFKGKYFGNDPSTGQPPPPAANTPVPQPPAGGIIGQTIKYSLFSTSKGITQATVTDVKEAATLPPGTIYPALTAKGKYVLVFVDVVNVGTESTNAYHGVKLRDNKGRTFDIADTQVQRNASEQYNIDAPQETLQPGIANKTVLVFDVATDATGYMLAGNR